MSAVATKTTKKVAKPKVAPTHPPVKDMVVAAITALKERKGSSLSAIKKYIAANNKVDVVRLAPFIRKCLKAGVEKAAFKQIKGSYKLGEKPKAEKIPTKVAAKKPTNEKKTKKAATKKPTAKKTPKTIAKKIPKKAAKPAKKAAVKKTPKKADKPAKKAVVKKTPSKSVAKKVAKPKKTPAKKTAKK